LTSKSGNGWTGHRDWTWFVGAD